MLIIVECKQERQGAYLAWGEFPKDLRKAVEEANRCEEKSREENIFFQKWVRAFTLLFLQGNVSTPVKISHMHDSKLPYLLS